MVQDVEKAGARERHSCGALLAQADAVTGASPSDNKRVAVRRNREMVSRDGAPPELPGYLKAQFFRRPHLQAHSSLVRRKPDLPLASVTPAVCALDGVIRISFGAHSHLFETVRAAAAACRKETGNRHAPVRKHQAARRLRRARKNRIGSRLLAQELAMCRVAEIIPLVTATLGAIIRAHGH